jgi:hypothetical protein
VDDRGYGSVFALALLFGGILLVGLAADVTRLVAVWQETSYVAHTSAEVGAGWVQSEPLYDGQLVLDTDAASAAATAFAAASGYQAVVAITGERVCVSVATDVAPGITRLVGVGLKPVAVTACAEPRQG